ncbi:Hypothetical predicted protein [Xyrichtys novacula]|uniref:Uncharacterized protein n=1 Tax=Xyrichtys novacula TaxID=13765 RepID=A0AAV1FWI3_XYRNO|nr:Hypothetical predicted protein [Xyrichtys novacula]
MTKASSILIFTSCFFEIDPYGRQCRPQSRSHGLLCWWTRKLFLDPLEEQKSPNKLPLPFTFALLIAFQPSRDVNQRFETNGS